MYAIFDKKDKEIIITNNYEVYQNQLESLGSFRDCSFFHIISVNEEEINRIIINNEFSTFKKVYL